MTSDATETLSARLDRHADRIFERMIAWRRDFHANPELGNQEHRTAGIVAEHLERLGFDEVRRNLGGSTGVIGILKGGQPGPCVALRADMDALPVREATGLDFASVKTADWGGETVPVMHACGHDAHTAVQMAVAEILATERDAIKGSVMLVFQPAEEGPAPDWQGLSGAERMVADGAFDDPKPDAFFCFHVLQDERPGTAGEIRVHEGDGTYAMNLMRIKIHGRGGHGAYPWRTVDPLLIGAQILTALQAIPAKNVDVNENAVTLSIGIFKGGTKFNVIPETAEMEGALRFTDGESGPYLESRVEAVAKGIAEAAGGRAEVDWYMRVPLVHNDPELLRRMRPSLERAAPADKPVVDVESCFLDDVSNFSSIAPLVFFTVGVGLDTDDPARSGFHHEPSFQVNEAGLATALRAMVNLAVDYGYDSARNDG
ncbi:amidohydrolase [Rhodobacter sp. NTK016B]|uniref:M20 metallopeptidase family protein n=1 Tax=Rhodobacter sp. NTK016B TaxID=2759676 RepID=UPI001A8FBDC1|nr:amidohydrolase [Rhodobacter sp. NTK016B]MBN8290592.1 amidohydrolase [Rhodobacter sp. NTK016B]